MSNQSTESKYVIFLDDRSPFWVKIGDTKYPMSLTVREGCTEQDLLVGITTLANTIAKIKGVTEDG